MWKHCYHRISTGSYVEKYSSFFSDFGQSSLDFFAGLISPFHHNTTARSSPCRHHRQTASLSTAPLRPWDREQPTGGESLPPYPIGLISPPPKLAGKSVAKHAAISSMMRILMCSFLFVRAETLFMVLLRPPRYQAIQRSHM